MPFTGLNQGIPWYTKVNLYCETNSDFALAFQSTDNYKLLQMRGVSAKLALGTGLLLCFAEKIKRCLHSFNDGGIMGLSKAPPYVNIMVVLSQDTMHIYIQYIYDHKAHQGTCPVSAAEIAALAVTTSAVKRLPR